MAEEAATETVQWSNADIEFPSTSTSDEIEIISQTDDETICKLLSALPVANDTVQNSNTLTEFKENASETNSSTEIKVDAESEISGNEKPIENYFEELVIFLQTNKQTHVNT